MVFEKSSDANVNWLGGDSAAPVSSSTITAINGIISSGISHSASGRLVWANFVSDEGYNMVNVGKYKFNGGIGTRNDGLGWYQVSTLQLVNRSVNDVAMTVLSNAPVDSATGLPVPTIAVGTDGGVSVIKDDGTVVDYTGFSPAQRVEIDSTYVYASTRSATNDYIFKSPLLSSDGTYYANIIAGSGGWYANSVSNANETPTLKNMTVTDMTITKDSTVIRSGNDGIEIFDGNVETIDDNEAIMPFAYITSDYNTGYMVGDIKGAFLSGISTANATYSTVADDWATAGAWTRQSNITITSTGSGTSGTLSITGANSGSNVYFLNSITVEANTDYVVSVYFSAYNANSFWINNSTYSGSGVLIDIGSQSGNIRGGQFNSGSNTTLYIQGWQVSGTATQITSLVVQKVSERDRSVNNKGLQVFGTITKEPVATGAELVSYSGISDSNYLISPPGSVSIGTNDFCVSFWYKRSTGDEINVFFDYVDGTADGFRIVPGNTVNDIYLVNGDFTTWVAFPGKARPGKWTQTTVVRNYGTDIKVYQDGDFVGTTSTFASTNYNVGGVVRVSGGAGTNISTCISLLRISASAPSEEQIRKMYEDEKHLFVENAKASLYGSSDAVTALAFDNATNLIHVGTSAGRSEFQGLSRINNTTTAVTTAISASNGLVTEQ